MSRQARLQQLDAQIKHHEYAAKSCYSNQVTARHRAVIRDLKRERQQLLMRRAAPDNPFEAAWCWLKEHPFLAIVAAVSPVMIVGGPAAIAGFFMIVMTLSILWLLARSLIKHLRAGPKGTDLPNFTEFSVPGGLIRVRGQLTEEEAEVLARQFERRGGKPARTVVLGPGQEFQPNAAPDPKLAPVMPESVSAMHAGRPDVVEPVHPELPAWMRQVWIKAIVDYRTRVTQEGRRYWNLKWQLRGMSHARSWDDLRTDPDPVRMADQLDKISDEGAFYGERLVRSNYGRAGFANRDGVQSAIDEVGLPEMPRDFVPILDRDFELTTDCRYHHVADHAIVEQSVSNGHVLRCCTVCEPATYWLERA